MVASCCGHSGPVLYLLVRSRLFRGHTEDRLDTRGAPRGARCRKGLVFNLEHRPNRNNQRAAALFYVPRLIHPCGVFVVFAAVGGAVYLRCEPYSRGGRRGWGGPEKKN